MGVGTDMGDDKSRDWFGEEQDPASAARKSSSRTLDQEVPAVCSTERPHPRKMRCPRGLSSQPKKGVVRRPPPFYRTTHSPQKSEFTRSRLPGFSRGEHLQPRNALKLSLVQEHAYQPCSPWGPNGICETLSDNSPFLNVVAQAKLQQGKSAYFFPSQATDPENNSARWRCILPKRNLRVSNPCEIAAHKNSQLTGPARLRCGPPLLCSGENTLDRVP